MTEKRSATVDWTATAEPGLRERKKRQTRQLLTDTATELFLERGFDAVRVAEIAAVCGVSEKTVFNYFPTKEALILDHPDTAMAALRTALADPERAPVDAVVAILAGELTALLTWLDGQDDPVAATARFQRFRTLIDNTPALRAHQRDQQEQLVTVAATALAARSGAGPDDPEPRIAATALVGLWPVQFASLRRHLDGVRTSAQVRRAVTADVRRAARLLERGLATLA